MQDLLFIGLAVALFVLSAAYVRGCQRLTSAGDDTFASASP